MVGSVLFFLLSFVGMIGPWIWGPECFEGGCAMTFISLVVFLSAGVCFFVFYWMANLQESIASDPTSIHWTYSIEEWKDFTQKDIILDAQDKKALFYVISAFSAFFAILFPIIDPENGYFVSLVMAALVVLIGFVAWYSIWLTRRENINGPYDTYISPKGIIFKNHLHAWTYFLSRFVGVEYDDKPLPGFLLFSYVTWQRRSAQFTTVRVPVPRGKEDEAKRVLADLGK